MRGLHTSDWHLGVFRHRLNRQPDHDRVLAQIKDIAMDEKVDFILHTGDLFEKESPAIEVLRYAWAALQELSSAAPVIVLCGNHDGAKLFELLGMVNGDHRRIYFIDPMTLARKRADSVIKLRTAADEIVRIGSVPFIKDESFIRDFVASDGDRATVTYADRVGKIEQMVGGWLSDGYNPNTDIRVFAAHLLVEGAQTSGSEYKFHVDKEFATYGNRIPTAEYVAFGHIHKPQTIPGVPHGRYAGSPLQVDFGEVRDDKLVYLIHGRPGRPLEIEERQLDFGRRLVDVRDGTLEQIRTNAAAYAGTIARVFVTLDTPLDELDARVRDALPDTIVCQVIPHYLRAEVEIVTGADIERGHEPTLDELFSKYVDQNESVGDPVRTKRYFSELLDRVERNDPSTSLAEIEAVL